jgi:hypothetical protein
MKRMRQLEAMRSTHADPDSITEEFCANRSRHGQKRERALRISGKASRIPGKTTGSIATHFSFSAIGVVVPHARHFSSPFDGDQAISAHAAMPVADPCNLSLCQTAAAVTIIDHYKVVSRTVHLGEL